MNSTEEKLKERIKELTCLYTVSSLVRDKKVTDKEDLLHQIAVSVKESIRFPEKAFVEINVKDHNISLGSPSKETIFIISAVHVFQQIEGSIKVGYPKLEFSQNSFLKEEQLLLNKIASEIGDFFERKEVEAKEKIAKMQLERVDRLAILGEIIAGIAHELNTPLANILGFTELLQERITKNDQDYKDLQKVINSAIYSREVVKKLMFFSCEMPQQMSLTNILPIIKEAIGLLSPNFQKKEIHCDLSYSNDSIMLKVDAIQMTQVMFNLLINAIYFSPIKGKIQVTVEDTAEEVVLKIYDQGTGIKKEAADKIYNPFYTTKGVGEGSGLGLSVVHGIVKSHKGSISYKKNKPKGTIFTISFPKS
ncbi:hypothetical protein GCM10011416_00130 [Polaribacter pacificus]|uniref:histidine kinase n=1 Tax=Polaribacter pacificus TaxID=1775173 RepID=A0A917M9I5_9FLAO|nr:HAMP domain-containing sensor histidine kinase [Polaribacter pacificus]GGG87891.1 hypothetical protein GCM10011416_00130 [Polaribacter pacificus]